MVKSVRLGIFSTRRGHWRYLSKKPYLLFSTCSTQEDKKTSRHELNIADLGEKYQHTHTKKLTFKKGYSSVSLKSVTSQDNDIYMYEVIWMCSSIICFRKIKKTILKLMFIKCHYFFATSQASNQYHGMANLRYKRCFIFICEHIWKCHYSFISCYIW